MIVGSYLVCPVCVCVCVSSSQLKEIHTHGATLMEQDASGRTLLHHAVTAGNIDIVKFITENGRH